MLFLSTLIFVGAVILVSCSSTRNYADIVKGKSYTTGQWLDDNAYAVTTIGLLGLQKESKGGVCPDDLDEEDLSHSTLLQWQLAE